MISQIFKSIRNRHKKYTRGFDAIGGNIRESDTPRGDPTMSFKIYNAQGGKVVEFYSYDRTSDFTDTQLYIIRDDEDFGDAIKNIAVIHRISTGKF